MFHGKNWIFVPALAGLLATSQALAAPAAKPPLDLSQDSAGVLTQIGQIRQELGDGKTYSEIAPGKKDEVLNALARITTAVEGAGSGRLPPDAQVAAFNDQETVNTILTVAREDSRLICKRERATGSTMMTSQCMTVAKRRELQEGGRKNLGEMRSFNNFKP